MPLWHILEDTGKQPLRELPPYAFEWVNLGDGTGWPKALALLPDVGYLYPCYISWGFDTAKEPKLGPPRFD